MGWTRNRRGKRNKHLVARERDRERQRERQREIERQTEWRRETERDRERAPRKSIPASAVGGDEVGFWMGRDRTRLDKIAMLCVE